MRNQSDLLRGGTQLANYKVLLKKLSRKRVFKLKWKVAFMENDNEEISLSVVDAAFQLLCLIEAIQFARSYDVHLRRSKAVNARMVIRIT